MTWLARGLGGWAPARFVDPSASTFCAETRSLLKPQRGPLQAAVRAELFGVQRFRQHATSLAKAQPTDSAARGRWGRGQQAFVPRLRANKATLALARSYLETLDRRGDSVGLAGEWLLDNFHLIEAQASEVRTGMPPGYYRALPKLMDAPLAGLPRVYGIAWAFVAHTDSNFDAALLCQFLSAYQTVDTLTLGELWAIPVTLRVVLLENLARLADGVARHRAAQQAANGCCDQPEEKAPQELQAVYAELRDPGLRASFLAQVATRVRGTLPKESAPWSAWLEGQLAERHGADSLIAQVQDGYAADNVSVANAVKALHAINRLNWKDLVEQVSPVLQSLQQSPAFVAESDLTRDQCTHAIERIARQLGQRELDVVHAVLAMPQAADDGAGPAHWLLGQGRAALMQALGGPVAGWRMPWQGMVPGLRGALYAALPLLGTWWLLHHLFQGPGPGLTGVQWLALPLALLVGFESLMTVMNRVLAETLRVQRLPRLALEAGLTEAQRTLVVVPCLLSSVPAVQALAQTLEQHYLANPERHTRFALLSDWKDSPTEHHAQDDTLLAAARQAIADLNQRYALDGQASADDAPRFALLHRARRWSEGERVWMGWERKRGKIEQLLTLLAAGGGGSDQGAVDGPPDQPFLDLGPISRWGRAVRYLMVLDSDTQMPPRSLREMVAIAAHPLNRPRLDPDTHRVVAGHGILQPRIAAPLPQREDITAFGWLFSAPWGFDVYNAGSSEVYQDLFAQGSFSGKGLLDVQAVHRSLQGRAPPDHLLSHDLYEGMWANAAYLSDVVLVEQQPMHPDVAASRSHRWTRGDWQLLALFRLALQGRVGALNLWKLIDNLRRSLLAPASLVLLWFSFATGAVAPLHALLLVAAAFGLGSFIGAVAALFPSRSDLAWPHFLREGAADLARALGGTLWLLATLPGAAVRQVDAIARAVWRMAVSRRRRLQWITAAQAQAAARLEWRSFWGPHLGEVVFVLVWMGTGLWMGDGGHVPWVLGLGTVWLLAPFWYWAVSQPLFAADKADPQDPCTDPGTRAYLHRLAREIWDFFEEVVTAADHHLPPDNLQLDPEPMLAHRTSPTNVGLYLSSCLCAHQLRFIDSAQLVSRLGATLATLDHLPRWHGHFYNWTDSATLEALGPRYVSTVDSGNLVACLWAAAQACQELAKREQGAGQAGLGHRLTELAAHLRSLADATEFGPLYDRKRRLFHIGFRVDGASLDPAYYDLLASESRLTSFVAIAKGDVPPAHWQALGRPFLAVGKQPALRSWSGSMFEYLMPTLLMRESDGGLLRRVARSAVQAQQAFGALLGLPWGVSECAYHLQDRQLAYQYGPIGVPQLALRRTPLEDQVVAPYATVLALMVDPAAALANLRVLEQHGARDRFGFIEALDFTASRLDEQGQRRRVFTYMAHHQGMSLLSLCNVLCEGAPQGWFQRTPRARACWSLMHERMPREIVYQAGAIPRPLRRPSEPHPAIQVRVLDPTACAPADMPTLLLGNGRYSVNLRPNGAGQSVWQGQAINRVRDDVLRDVFGHWLMLRCDGDEHFASLTSAPHPHASARYETRFFDERAEFDTITPGWTSRLTVWVSPDDAVELREVVLHNLGDEACEMALLSWFEAAMAPQRADEAHPAFSKLFVHAHAAAPDCLLLQRQPRGEGERGLWVAHFLAWCQAEVQPAQVQVACDRAGLLSQRGGASPASGAAASGARAELDTGLDPMASLTVRLRLDAHTQVTCVVATAAADDAATLMAIVDQYRQRVHVTRSRHKAQALARIRRREQRLDPQDARAVHDLATAMAMNRSRPRPPPGQAPEAGRASGGDAQPVHPGANCRVDRRALWRQSISGDRPIALMRIHDAQGLPAVRALLVAQSACAMGGVVCDVVIVNTEPTSYLMPLQPQLAQLRESLGGEPQPHAEHGGVFILRDTELSAAEWAALQAHARLDVLANGPPLWRLVARAGLASGAGPEVVATLRAPQRPTGLPPPPQTLAEAGFTEQGRAFEIRLDATRSTPRPWANVIANPDFGCVITESGGGFTWARNSRMNQLTPWSNDPVLDPPGEHFWALDPDSGEVFDLLPGGDRNGAAGFRVTHRAGRSSFAQQRGDLDIEFSVAVHPHESAKCLSLRVLNRGQPARRLQLLAMVEWVMGAQRSARMGLQTEHRSGLQAVFARQLEHEGGHGEGTAFLMLHGLPVTQWTCDRAEFFNAAGQLQWPQAWTGAHGFGLDPCGALGAELALAGGASQALQWVLGYADSPDAASALAQRLREPGELAQLHARVDAHWEALLSTVTVHTPDPAFDALVNHWLLYQTLSCRLWGRAGLYQASGATGFRDQLQDTLALAASRPDLLRAQLLLHASRQFLEGDVQHWWHAPSGVGVRTRFSDDLLWLPYAAQHHGQVSGDWTVLDETVPFLDGAELAEGADDAYFVPVDSGVTASLFEHAARAIDRSLRTGAHGLPLMGSGDWNDGMNRVGHQGRGESVWLAMFLLVILRDWVPLAQARGETRRAVAWQQASEALEAALHTHGWDGAWFRRAYFDSGQPLGSKDGDECRIDLIAQAWSVFALSPGHERARQAMCSADAELVDRQAGLLRLLTPPLQHAPQRAGYIQAYPPGVRENGGQYAHGAVWAVIAQAELGHPERAWDYFRMLSPAHRSAEPPQRHRYGLEPYVMAGDVCSAPPYTGRGGWSWYSGSAAWMHRAALEHLIGLRVRADRFCLQPSLPAAWPEVRVRVRLRGKDIEVWMHRPSVRPSGAQPARDRLAVEIGQWLAFADLPDVCALRLLLPAIGGVPL